MNSNATSVYARGGGKKMISYGGGGQNNCLDTEGQNQKGLSELSWSKNLLGTGYVTRGIL